MTDPCPKIYVEILFTPHLDASTSTSAPKREPSVQPDDTENVSNDGSASKNTQEVRKCFEDEWDHKVITNRTLIGGINAGDFRDHGQTDTMTDCMSFCCSDPDCDLSFMIDKDCYSIHCYKTSLCHTRVAKPTSFLPQIAFKKTSKVGMYITKGGLISLQVHDTYYIFQCYFSVISFGDLLVSNTDYFIAEIYLIVLLDIMHEISLTLGCTQVRKRSSFFLSSWILGRLKNSVKAKLSWLVLNFSFHIT